MLDTLPLDVLVFTTLVNVAKVVYYLGRFAPSLSCADVFDILETLGVAT